MSVMTAENRKAEGKPAAGGEGPLLSVRDLKVHFPISRPGLFLPPTLVASIYGMNFAFMPELGHPLGYPVALGLMLLSAVVTWVVFKWKRWL